MFLCTIYLPYSIVVLLDIYQEFRVMNGEYIVKISIGIVELVYQVKPFYTPGGLT